jgi:hypothetical protein
VDLVGSDRLIRLLIAAGGGAGEAMERGLYEEGQLAFRGSQKEVPYRFGILKGSGRLFPPSSDGAGNVEVVLGYGGAAKKYAAAVHELDKNYNNGKKRYYLLDPVQARVPNMDARLAKRIERIIGEANA